jgi:hypothetical protein
VPCAGRVDPHHHWYRHEQEVRVLDQHADVVAVHGEHAACVCSRPATPLSCPDPDADAPPLSSQLEKKGTITNELSVVLSSTAIACKQISSLVNRSGISNLTGLAGAANIQASVLRYAGRMHGRLSKTQLQARMQHGSRACMHAPRPVISPPRRARTRRSWTSCRTRCSRTACPSAAAP